MTLLVTGGGGFVMSNLVRHWLESDAEARVVAVDSAPLDAIAERYFEAVRERLEVFEGDVRDGARWEALADRHDITRVVHGAAVTPIAWDDAGLRRDPEAENPRRVIAANVMGTVATLDFARRLPRLERFVYVSSGAVYADEGPSPLPEDGYVDARTLYPVSKHAGELITRRYAELFGLDAVAVRLASVYGPMDRWTPTRKHACVPNRIAHLALAGETIRVRTPEAAGDWIYAPDVAAALAALLRAPRLAHPVYNVAYGEAVSVGALIAIAAQAVPGTRHEVTADKAHIADEPRPRGGRYGAYDIARVSRELGWRPRPIAEAMRDYIDWIRNFENAP
ncbi:MAG: NAD-dependent epimerase/dehydratase family protein [Alphaproteobacteria bacterium]